MSIGVPLHSVRSRSFTAAQLLDPNGVKTSIATSASAASYTGADLDGALVVDTATGRLAWPRTITITTAANTGTYNIVDPIVFTGLRGGTEVSEELTLTDEDGGETVYGSQPFDWVTSIATPAQNDTSGSFQFGVADICCRHGDRFTAVMVHADGQLNLCFDPRGANDVDSFPAKASTIHPIAFHRVMTSSGLSVPTAVGVTVWTP